VSAWSIDALVVVVPVHDEAELLDSCLSSLAAAIGYPDIMQIVGGTVASQTSQALEAMSLVVLLYAAINLLIAVAASVANRRLLRHEGRAA